MSLFARGVGNARALFRSTPPQFGDSSIPAPGASGVAGGVVTKVSGALAISTVLNCLRVLHDDFTTLPLRGYTGIRGGVRQAMKTQPQVVREPFGPDVSPQEGFAQIVTGVRSAGSVYLWVVDTDREGNPTLLQILPIGQCHAEWDDNGRKQFRIGTKTYGPTKIKQINGMMLPGAAAGIDPLSYQRITNQLAVDVNQYAGNFFQNGGSPGGVIEANGAGSKEKAREIAQIWEAAHSGVNNAHRPGVIFNAKWTQTAIPPENAQFLETRQFLRSEISGWYGVPLERINAADSTSRTPAAAGGLEGIDEDYAKHGLLPLCVSIESVWDRMIPGGEGAWAQFDFMALLRPSPLSRAQIRQIDRVTAVRSPNEGRADEGLPPYEGGDDFDKPLNSNTSGAPAGNHNDPSVDQGQDGQETPGVTGGGK